MEPEVQPGMGRDTWAALVPEVDHADGMDVLCETHAAIWPAPGQSQVHHQARLGSLVGCFDRRSKASAGPAAQAGDMGRQHALACSNNGLLRYRFCETDGLPGAFSCRRRVCEGPA